MFLHVSLKIELPISQSLILPSKLHLLRDPTLLDITPEIMAFIQKAMLAAHQANVDQLLAQTKEEAKASPTKHLPKDRLTVEPQ